MGKYDALTEFLRGRSEPVVDLSFVELDRIIDGLPRSARQHAAWWANSRTAQPHAHCWLDAGRRAQPEFNSGRVRFTIGSETRYGPRTSSRSTFELTGEQLSTTISIEWALAGSVSLRGGRPVFPHLPAAPAIYRFSISNDAAGERSYIGETDNLSRRMGNYRNPGPTQPTNQRLHRTIVDVLGRGGQVELAVVLQATVDGNPLDLRSKAARRLVENAALVRLELDGATVENL